MKKVSVIIPVFNAENSVGKVLVALEKQDYPDFEVIVVDDNSQDGTVKIIKNHYFFYPISDYPKLIMNETNLGLAKSMNRGIRESTGEIIITLHDDCVPLSNTWVSDMVKVFDTGSRIGIVTSDFLIDFQSLSIADKLFTFAYHVGDDINLSNKKGIEDIDMISDKCDCYRRDILFKVGLFDENFRLGGEDADLSYRVKNAGYRIVRNNEIAVEHIFNQSHREDSILNHFAKAFKSTEDAVYVLLRHGMWYKFDSFLAVILLMAGAFSIYFAFLSLGYLLAKNFLKSLRYYYRYRKFDLIIPIWIFCFVWDILAGLGWIAGLLSTVFRR